MTTDEAKTQYRAALNAIIDADPVVGPARQQRDALAAQISPLIVQLKAAPNQAAQQVLLAQINPLQRQFSELNNRVHNSGTLDVQAAMQALDRLR